MQATMRSICGSMTLTLLTLLVAGPPAPGQEPTAGSDGDAVPSVPLAPQDLVYLRPFEVEQAMDFIVDGEKRPIKKGWVLVLKADKRILQPYNAPDHVLFVGGCVAHKVNIGYRDGHLIVIVPEVDWTRTCVFFGSRLLPDRLRPEDVARELLAAEARGLEPFSQEKLRSVRVPGETVLRAKDLNELWFETKPLILRYAPGEREMAESLAR